MKSEIVDITNICKEFPAPVDSEIVRDNMLDLIEQTLSDKVVALIIEGEQGIGKTTILAQFAKRFGLDVICLFIQQYCRIAYASDYLKSVILEQAKWLIHGKMVDIEDASDAEYSKNIRSLQTRAHRRNKDLYFIVDNLEDLIIQDEWVVDHIIKNLLPLGMNRFRFIFTGSWDKLKIFFPRAIEKKPNTIPAFSIDESKRYLSGLEINEDDIITLHKMSRGIPANMYSVKRLLSSGTDLDNIMNLKDISQSALLEFEWSKYQESVDKYHELLGVVAFAIEQYDVKEYSNILKVDEKECTNIIGNLPFICVDGEGKVAYVSEFHKEFAKTKLARERQIYLNLLIEYHQGEPRETIGLNGVLPDYYYMAGSPGEVIQCLDQKFFENLLSHSKSVFPLCSRAELGLNASLELNNFESTIKFSAQKALFAGLVGMGLQRSEIHARLAAEDIEAAMAIANNNFLKEDRLIALSIIARHEYELNGCVSSDLVSEIEIMCEQIDIHSMGESVFEISSNLIAYDPELAIKLIEGISGDDGRNISFDLALGKLSLLAATKGSKRSVHASVDVVESKITNEEIRSTFSATTSIFLNNSVKAFLSSIKGIDYNKKIQIVITYLVTNANIDDYELIINEALDCMMMAPEYKPKNSDLRKIASALSKVSDVKALKKIVSRIDSLKIETDKLSSSVEYTRLQMTLAEGELRYNQEAYKNRILETYFNIAELSSVETKCACYAWYISFISKLDIEGHIEKSEGVLSLSKSEFSDLVDTILKDTGDHFGVFEQIIDAIAQYDAHSAMSIVDKFNVQFRRDRAIKRTIKAIMEKDISYDKITFSIESLPKIESVEIRDEILVNLISILNESENIDYEIMKDACYKLISKLDDVNENAIKCWSYCLAYCFLFKYEKKLKSKIMNSLLSKMNVAWDNLDIEYIKIELGYDIARQLYEVENELGAEWLKRTDQYKRTAVFCAEDIAFSYFDIVDLTIRSFCGLLYRKINQDEDLDRVINLIEHVRSNYYRCYLFNSLAMRLHSCDYKDLAQKIAMKFILPLIKSVKSEEINLKRKIIILTSPTFYLVHQATWEDLIKDLDDLSLNRACDLAIKYIFSKLPPSEPIFHESETIFKIKHTDALDICLILNKMSNDDLIFMNIETLVNSINSKANMYFFTVDQKNDIIRKLEEIVDDKLPDKNNINHDGYKILTHVIFCRAMRCGKDKWLNLLNEIGQIPCASDRAFLYSSMSKYVPDKYKDVKKQVIEGTVKALDVIPSNFDRTSRSIWAAEQTKGYDIVLSKKLLADSFSKTIDGEQIEDYYEFQKNIIDVAYQLDPVFAESLVNLIDDDPARSFAKARAKSKLKESQNGYDFIDYVRGKKDILKDKARIIEKAALKNLSLVNANKTSPLNMEEITTLLKRASELPPKESYTVLACAIENAIKRYRDTNQAPTYLHPLFEATCLGAEVCYQIAVKICNADFQVFNKRGLLRDDKEDGVLKPGDRDQALLIIRRWIENDLDDFLIICDPYFSSGELDLIQTVISINNDCKITVLIDGNLRENKVLEDIEVSYRDLWKNKLSMFDTDRIRIIVINIEGVGTFPVHDRWLLTNSSGLRIGTSLNSIGLNKISEVSKMDPEESSAALNAIQPYLNIDARHYKGNRINYRIFYL